MRTVIYCVAVLLLLGSTAFADIDPYNTRQVPISAGPASEMTLQQILNAIYGPGVMNAATDQQMAGIWQLSGPGTKATAPILQFEEAGNKDSNVFGIWSGHDPNAIPTRVPIFLGGAGQNTQATLQWIAGSPNSVHITGGSGVNVGTFSGISRYWFGFYLEGPGGLFYTADQLNGGNAQALVYRQMPDNNWTIAFEDKPFASTDKDYNDLVVTAESITPVPEPGAVLLLGAMLLGSLPLGRFFRKSS